MPKDSYHSKTEQVCFSECIIIQDDGKENCPRCSVYNTDKCNGQRILKTGKNLLGFKIPLKKY